MTYWTEKAFRIGVANISTGVLYFPFSKMNFLGKVWPQLPQKPSQNAKWRFRMVTTPFPSTKHKPNNSMFYIFLEKNTIKSSNETRKKLSSLRRSFKFSKFMRKLTAWSSLNTSDLQQTWDTGYWPTLKAAEMKFYFHYSDVANDSWNFNLSKQYNGKLNRHAPISNAIGSPGVNTINIWLPYE